MNKKQLNDFYGILCDKARNLSSPFISKPEEYRCEVGFYNGHYSKNEKGDYEMEFYPIPVISIMGICDIEVEIDVVSVSSKLTKTQAEKLDYSLLQGYRFEAYGVENFTEDYYTQGVSLEDFICRVKASDEKDIGFSFIFDSMNAIEVKAFVEFLVKNGFFY